MRFLLLTILSLASIHSKAQKGDLTLSGYLLSKDDNKPIIYASIINLTNPKYGTTTDNEGFFQLMFNEDAKLDQIHFSSLGFQDTTLTVAQLNRPNVRLALESKPFRLPDFEVVPGNWISDQIGNREGKVHVEDNGVSMSTPGQGFAAFINPPNRKMMVLDSLEIYIGEKNFNSPFTLRVLVHESRKKLKKRKLYKVSEFEDILTEKVTYTPKAPGWFKINLSDYEVQLPKEGVFLTFNQLDTSDDFYWQGRTLLNYIGENDSSQQRYGHTIGLRITERSKIQDAIYSGNLIAIFGKYDFQGALVVNYSHKE
jgi:hypothetical protein